MRRIEVKGLDEKKMTRDEIIDSLAGKIDIGRDLTLEEILDLKHEMHIIQTRPKPFETVWMSDEGKSLLRKIWRKYVKSLRLEYWRPSMYHRIWTWWWMKSDYPRMHDDWIDLLLPVVILSHGKQAPSDRPLHGETPGPENVNPNLGM